MSTRIRAIVGITLTALALGACSFDQPAPTSSPEASAISKTSATRTVTDASGQGVALPSHPSHVVTLSEPTANGTLALGVTPIGVVSGRGQQTVPDYLVEHADGIPILNSIDTPNLEVIGAAHPDLILVDGASMKNNDTETLTTLAQIAPIFFAARKDGDWRETFTLTADAFGTVNQTEAELTEFDQHVASVSARLKNADYPDQTYSVVRQQDDSADLTLRELLADQTLTALDMERPANQNRDGGGHSEPVSLENIDQIDANWVFFGTLGKASVNSPSAGGNTGVKVSAAALEEARATVGLDSLGAVKMDHTIPVNDSLWTSIGGYLLMDGIVSSIEAQFVLVS